MSINNEILIIGNGNSILNYNFGSNIDQFDNVARINNYSIKKYSTYVGSKTDVWFNGANQNVRPRKNNPKKIIILVPPEILLRKNKLIHDKIKRNQKLLPNQYRLISYEILLEYEKKYSIKRLTTGTNAILWALDNYKKVIIHGFDFFISSKSHYFDNRLLKYLIDIGLINKVKKHNLEREKEIINNFINSGKITYLKDIVK